SLAARGNIHSGHAHSPRGLSGRGDPTPAAVTVGSVNLDNRSFALNDELNISFRDPGVVAALEEHFLADVQDSRELTRAAWRARPLAKRSRELTSAFVGRQL